MKLIVGLGNPGPQYMMTRHNAGFWVTDRLATKYGADKFRLEPRFDAYMMKVQIGGEQVWLAQPDTMMNGSGQSVLTILNFYKLELSQLLVIHDDVSIPLGKLRVQSGGGAGGNHGIENILNRLGGARDFDRLKFGVGPDPGGARRADFVLSTFPPDLVDLKNKMIELALEAAELWLREGPQVAANKINGLDLRPSPPPPEPPPAPPQVQEIPGKEPLSDV
jgi:PTH1 family peptidyl-tRNA hydrolase